MKTRGLGDRYHLLEAVSYAHAGLRTLRRWMSSSCHACRYPGYSKVRVERNAKLERQLGDPRGHVGRRGIARFKDKPRKTLHARWK